MEIIFSHSKSLLTINELLTPSKAMSFQSNCWHEKIDGALLWTHLQYIFFCVMLFDPFLWINHALPDIELLEDVFCVFSMLILVCDFLCFTLFINCCVTIIYRLNPLLQNISNCFSSFWYCHVFLILAMY